MGWRERFWGSEGGDGPPATEEEIEQLAIDIAELTVAYGEHLTPEMNKHIDTLALGKLADYTLLLLKGLLLKY